MAVQQQNHKKRIHGHAESGRGIVSKAKGKYSVELFKEGGEGAGQEEIIDRHDNLTVARAIYRGRVAQYSGRPIMLRDCLRLFGPEIVRHNCGQRSWRGQARDPLV
jgi:hypothetical protein